jgi:uncharacterized protein YbjT (DUF2867 family)
MPTTEGRVIVVTGATGLQGGAVSRHLLQDGWSVRALTRDPRSAAAQALAAQGAVVVQGDMEDVASLRSAFAGAAGVYSVQNPYLGGPEREVLQGKNVANVAQELGVPHLVYASAGTGQPDTGVPSWETKRQVEAHLQALGLPHTVLRPMAFMELMTHKKFFPAASTWHLMPALMGATRPVGWVCTDDLGAMAAQAFADPDRFIGQALSLVSDVQTLDQCRALYRAVVGKNPRVLPLPGWVFGRFGFVGRDLTTMWQWLRTATFDLDPTLTRALLPQAHTVHDWLRTQRPA